MPDPSLDDAVEATPPDVAEAQTPAAPKPPPLLAEQSPEAPPLLRAPDAGAVEATPPSDDAIPVSDREQAAIEARQAITEHREGKRPELTEQQLTSLELMAADDKTGYDRMMDALWEGGKQVKGVFKSAKEAIEKPHQPTPEEEEKIRTRREELIASGHTTIQSELEAEREFRREHTEKMARELGQGAGLMAVGLPSVVQDLAVGAGDILSSPLQVLPGVGGYIKGNIARNRAQADIVKHHTEKIANAISEKTGVSRDSAMGMIGENLAYMLLPAGELATAADISRAVKMGVGYSRGVTGTAAEVVKSATAMGAPLVERAVAGSVKAGVGHAMDAVLGAFGIPTFHGGAIGGEVAGMWMRQPKVVDAVYKKIADMPAKDFAKKSFELAKDKPLGQPTNEFIGGVARRKAVVRAQEADTLKAGMKPEDIVAAQDKAVDGSWKVKDENLSPNAKKLRDTLNEVTDLHEKADIAYRQGKLSKLLEFGANVSGNVAAHATQAGLLGAGFSGSGATTGEAAPAVAQGMAIGTVLGTGSTPLTVPAGMRAGRLKAGDAALYARGKDKIKGDYSVLNTNDQRRMIKTAGFMDSMGATLHINTPEEMNKIAGQPIGTDPGSGFVSPDGKNVHLNVDAIPRGGGNISGVEAHEFTHITERFLGETLRKLAPEHMAEFERQYDEALGTTGQAGFNSRAERDAEVGRLVLQNTPIEYFYGGETGGDIIKNRLGKIFGGMLGKNGVKTINGFEAPYTPADIRQMRQRFFKAGEAAAREGVTPDTHKAWTPDQQNIVKQWTKAYVDKGMSPDDASKKVAEDIKGITKGPPPEPEPQPPPATPAPAGPAHKPDNVDWINFPKEEPPPKDYSGPPPQRGVIKKYQLMPSKAKPITKEEARGNSRPVAQDEFDKLSEIGQRRLASLQDNPSPPTGLDNNWENIKQNSWLKAQADWGGDTIDAHTGKSVTPAEKSGPFSLTVKEPGQESVVIPEDATQEQFNSAMDKARKRFDKQLSYKDHHLGVFHDNDKGTIDIDPVLVVKNAGDIETIGAHTHAVGGAFDYATGNGYFPPHVDPSLPNRIGARQGAGGIWDSTFVSGEGAEMRETMAKELGGDKSKYFHEQKPAVQKAITEHFKGTGEAQYMPSVKDFQGLAKEAGYEFQGDLDGVLFWKHPTTGKEITAEPWRGRENAIKDFKDKLSGKYVTGQDLSKYSKSQAYGQYGERKRLKGEGERDYMPSKKEDYRSYIMRTPVREHMSQYGGIDEPRIYVSNTEMPRRTEDFKGPYQHHIPIGDKQENVSFLNPKVVTHTRGGLPYLRTMAKEAQAQGHDGLVILNKNAVLPADVNQKGLGAYPEAREAFYKNDEDFADWVKANPDKYDWENQRNVYVPLEGSQSKEKAGMTEREIFKNVPSKPPDTPRQRELDKLRETSEPRPEERAGDWWKKEGGTPFEDMQFMPSKHPDAIKEPAFRAEDGEVISAPVGYHSMIKLNKEQGRKRLTAGFVTNKGDFLDRFQALDRAKQHNQISKATADPRNWTETAIDQALHAPDVKEGSTSVPWQYMPSPHPEAVKAEEPAAIRTPDGKTHTGRSHALAYANMTEKYSADQLGKWAREHGEDNYFEGNLYQLNNGKIVDEQTAHDNALKHKQMTQGDIERMQAQQRRAGVRVRPIESMALRSADKEAPKQTFAQQYMPESKKEWEYKSPSTMLGPKERINKATGEVQQYQEQSYDRIGGSRYKWVTTKEPAKKTPKEEFEAEKALHKPQIELANKLATAAHTDQKRKFTGEEYMQHPTQVAELVKDELKPAALLHDAVEDGKTTLAALRKAGIGEDTLNTIEALTRRKGETYAKYIDRLKDNPNARDIKVADLYNNLQTLPRDSTLKSRYVKALNTMVPTDAQMRFVLKEDQKDMVGAHRDKLKAGDPVALRIDIPAYLKHGKYAVTIHEGKKVGPRMGYDGIAIVDNPNFFVQEAGAERVSTGGSHKFPMAAVGGDFNPSRVLPDDIGDYSMVGMNPMKHSYFYEKGTGQPVIGGDQAISVGNSVFVKNPIYGKKEDFRYMPSSPKEAREATLKEAQDHPEAKELRWKRDENGEVTMYPVYDKKTKKLIGYEARPAEEGYNLANQYLAKEAAKGIAGKAQQHEAKTDVASDGVVRTYHQVKDNPEVMQAKGWYRELKETLQKKLGGSMADLVLFTRLLATTSPNTNPAVNFGFALDAWNRNRRGEYKDVIARYQDALQKYKAGTLTHSDGKAVKTFKQWEGYLHGNDIIPYGSGFHEKGPQKGDPKKLGMHSLRVLDVISGHYDRIKGLKINQFAHNLAQTDLKATIDLWAARTIHRLLNEGNPEKQWRILPQNEKGISDADFKFGQDVFDKAAKKLGIATDDLQAIMWFAEKVHYDKQGWSPYLDKGDFRPLVKSMKPTGGGTFSYTPILKAKPPKKVFNE